MKKSSFAGIEPKIATFAKKYAVSHKGIRVASAGKDHPYDNICYRFELTNGGYFKGDLYYATALDEKNYSFIMRPYLSLVIQLGSIAKISNQNAFLKYILNSSFKMTDYFSLALENDILVLYLKGRADNINVNCLEFVLEMMKYVSDKMFGDISRYYGLIPITHGYQKASCELH